MCVIVLLATLVCLVNLVRMSRDVLYIIFYILFNIAICTSPCLYGGTCVAPEDCECVLPYGGDDCSQSE